MKREEAINRLRDIIIEIRTYCDESKHMSETDRQNMKAFDMAIKALEQELKWIPVSERLPDSDGDYFLFGKVVEDDDTENIFIGMYDACAEKFGYWEDYYDSKTLGFLDSDLIEYSKVIAWMPLPEPYKAESEDKE